MFAPERRREILRCIAAGPMGRSFRRGMRDDGRGSNPVQSGHSVVGIRGGKTEDGCVQEGEEEDGELIPQFASRERRGH